MQNLINENPLVSVVVASYNMGQYIESAIESILAQDWSPLEVIVVDDGSTDDTTEIMCKFKGDPRIKYIKNENQGQPKAKNCGIKNTNGEFIAFCDADDLWEPFKLSTQMPYFNNPLVGVVYSEISNIDEHNRRYQKPPAYIRYTGKVTQQLLTKNFIPFGTAVIRRSCVEKNGCFDEQFQMGIDWDLWLRYSLEWEFEYAPEKTYIYREWSGQMSSNYRGRYECASRILKNFVDKHEHQLDKNHVRLAWADTFVNQANAIAINENKVWEPLLGYAKGVSVSPFYWNAWRSLIKFLLGMQKRK